MPTEIAVVGAGIIGLSSALAIQQNCPGVKVTVIADKFTRHTTSHGAGGLFVPVGHGIDEKVYDVWAREGAKHFFNLAFSSEGARSGINFTSGYELLNKDEERPFLKYVLSVSKMSPEFMEKFIPHYKYGIKFTTVVVDSSKYLPWLTERIVANGGQIVERKIKSFSELSGKYNVVVNCTGLGSRDLTSDTDIHSVRGHIIRISAPWIKHFFHSDDNRYIIPSSDTVAIGGVKQPGRTDLAPVPEESQALLEDMKERFPMIKDAQVLYEWVGLRPGRSKVRLESEVMTFNGTPMKVIHNYGHGAFGISLSWGTGFHVSQIVKDLMAIPRPKL